ncbi:MAG: hypothetical protein ACLGH3_06955 [Actinomycetota bacterium]
MRNHTLASQAFLAALVLVPAVRVAADAPTPTDEVLQAVLQSGLTVPLADGRPCPTDRIYASYQVPPLAFGQGAYVEPLGPDPNSGAPAVAGYLACEGSQHALAGFDAIRTAEGWVSIPIPDPGGLEVEVEPHGFESEADPRGVSGVDPETGGSIEPQIADSKPVILPMPPLPSDIEPYASYDPQDTCDPTDKPGVIAFRKETVANNPGTGWGGISRACRSTISEHYEGRAWDWTVSAYNATQKRQAEGVMNSLFAADRWGNQHAKARRLGIMYIIWNKRIWGAYRARDGWRAYNGSSPHTDHVHFSFSWPGAMKLTSYWTGQVAVMDAAPVADEGPALPTATVAPPTETVGPAPEGFVPPARVVVPAPEGSAPEPMAPEGLLHL